MATNTEDVDRVGRMYKEDWVQALIRQLQGYIRENQTWFGIDASQEQRVLDYACGHGTVSAALAPHCPATRFQGIDVLDAQVARFNATARALLGESEALGRMFAVEGDLQHPGAELTGDTWDDFDVAVISMGLHHVESPGEMVRLLTQRVRKGGVLVIIEFLIPKQQRGSRTWPGFPVQQIHDMMKTECRAVDIRMDPTQTNLPEEFGGEAQIFYAKGIVE